MESGWTCHDGSIVIIFDRSVYLLQVTLSGLGWYQGKLPEIERINRSSIGLSVCSDLFRKAFQGDTLKNTVMAMCSMDAIMS